MQRRRHFTKVEKGVCYNFKILIFVFQILTCSDNSLDVLNQSYMPWQKSQLSNFFKKDEKQPSFPTDSQPLPFHNQLESGGDIVA